MTQRAFQNWIQLIIVGTNRDQQIETNFGKGTAIEVTNESQNLFKYLISSTKISETADTCPKLTLGPIPSQFVAKGCGSIAV